MTISPRTQRSVHTNVGLGARDQGHSLALPNGSFLPHQRADDLPNILTTPIGLIDTVVLQLDAAVCRQDIERLLATGDEESVGVDKLAGKLVRKPF